MDSTNLLNRLQDAVEAKTDSALADLAALEGQIAEALLNAEAAAAERIAQEADRIASTFEARLNALVGHIGRMAASAFDRTTNRMTASVDSLMNDLTGSPQSPPELTPEPAQQEAAIVPQPAMPIIQEGPAPATATVAACSLPGQDVGVLPEGEGDAIEDGGMIESLTAAPPVTRDPEGLHSKRGNGRRATFTLVDHPEPGGLYFRKVGRRWAAVRFVSE